MKTDVPVTAVVLTPTASSAPSFVAWLKPPSAPPVGLIRFLRVEKAPPLFGRLPNIKGRFDNTFGPEHATGGDAIYAIGPGVTHVSVNSDGEYPNWAIGFDASKSSPFYGNADTVQPHSVRTLVLVRAY